MGSGNGNRTVGWSQSVPEEWTVVGWWVVEVVAEVVVGVWSVVADSWREELTPLEEAAPPPDH